MQPLIISQFSLTPFQIPFNTPFSFAGNTVSERAGFYVTLQSDSGLAVQSEASPLPGVSQETLKHCRHDLQEIENHLKGLSIVADQNFLIKQLKKDEKISNLCPSARFAIESACFLLAAQSQNLSLAEFLGASLSDLTSACLLQGTYDQVIKDSKELSEAGFKVFKLKVGDRNIPLDVKKVNDLRKLLPKDCLLRLDGNRIWSLKEALLFVDLVGHERIEFMEEPLSDISQLNKFYEITHMPVALDETLAVVKCGVNAPGRCSPTLAHHEAVKAYILKSMVLGFTSTLDWMEEAKSLGRKAIISSSFESSVGLKILANLALVSAQVPGLGTERWMKMQQLINSKGIILKESLK